MIRLLRPVPSFEEVGTIRGCAPEQCLSPQLVLPPIFEMCQYLKCIILRCSMVTLVAQYARYTPPKE